LLRIVGRAVATHTIAEPLIGVMAISDKFAESGVDLGEIW